MKPWVWTVRRRVAARSFNPPPASRVYVGVILCCHRVSAGDETRASLSKSLLDAGSGMWGNQSTQSLQSEEIQKKKRECVHTCQSVKHLRWLKTGGTSTPYIQYMLKVANNELWLLLIWHCLFSIHPLLMSPNGPQQHWTLYWLGFSYL